MPKWRLFNVFGIPLYADATFFALVAICVLSRGNILSGLSFAALLSASIVLHELGHSKTAEAFGYGTRDITLSVLGGCASLDAIPEKPSEELTVAAAGPAVSFMLSLVGAVIWQTTGNSTAADLLVMNLMLGCFNLLPGFPMDGGRVLRAALSSFMPRTKATFAAMCVGRVFAVLLGCCGVWSFFTGGLGITAVLIAYMIWKTGYQEYQAVVWSGWQRWGDI